MYPVIVGIQIYVLIVIVDVLLAWVQPDSARWPRRATHALTEPIQRPLRAALGRVPMGGWDVSPVVVVVLLGVLRVALVRP